MAGGFLNHNSSNAPNFQNIPEPVREAIVPEDGNSFICSDYAQLELVIMADRSRDPGMLDVYMHNGDIHSETQRACKVTHRKTAKNINFGAIYKMGPATLQKQLFVNDRIRQPLSDCERFLRDYFKARPGVVRYHDRVMQDLEERGYVRSYVGRYRRLRKLFRIDKHGAHRVGINFTIQGSAADIVKIAMRNIYREILVRKRQDPRWARVHQIIQVHDEILIEGPDEIAEEIRMVLKQGMESAIKFPSGVPLRAVAGIGKNWLAAKKNGDVRDKAEKKLLEEAIKAGGAA